VKPHEDKYVKNVSVEEWDCPEPGSKKYMPRHVRENIRRNYKKITSEKQVVASDSVRRRQ
jgi:hypothetical protein